MFRPIIGGTVCDRYGKEFIVSRNGLPTDCTHNWMWLGASHIPKAVGDECDVCEGYYQCVN